MKTNFFKNVFSKVKLNGTGKEKAKGKAKKEKTPKLTAKPLKMKRFSVMNSINLRTKLYISFSFLIICSIIIGLIGVMNIRKINAQSKSMYEHNLKSITLLHSIREDVFLDLNSINQLNKYASTTELDKLTANTKNLNELIAEFKKNADTKVNKNLVDLLLDRYKSYNSYKDQFIELNKDQNQDKSLIVGMIGNCADNVDITLDSLIKYNEKQADLAAENSDKIFNNVMVFTTILILITILLSILIAIFISTNISSQVKKIMNFANVLKNKDLSTDIEVTGKDEFSKISKALMDTKHSIKDIISNISNMAENMGAGSEELSSTIQEITSKMEEVNSNTETIVKGTEELSSLTEEVTALTLESGKSINILSDKSQLGNKISKNIEQRAVEIKSKTNESLKAADDLYEANQKKIAEAINEGKIVNEVKVMADTIGQIAEQTNLLALNAAIEAARAGEHGRGFAVVADEVRKLAEQSSKTVTHIQDIVKRVQKAFNNLSDTSGDILKYMTDNIRPDYLYFVEASSQYVEDAKSISGVSNEIANSAAEMAAAMEQIGSAMQNVSATTQEDLSNSEQISSSIEETSRALDEISEAAVNQAEISESINRIIQEFKL